MKHCKTVINIEENTGGIVVRLSHLVLNAGCVKTLVNLVLSRLIVINICVIYHVNIALTLCNANKH